MLAIENAIRKRVRDLPAFVGWSVRGGTTDADRRPVPAVDVRMGGYDIPESRRPAVTVQARWLVSVVLRRSDEAAGQLDAAMAALIGNLHNWRPEVEGRAWTELQAVSVGEVLSSDAGLVGYEITFTTAAVYHGQS